MATFNYSDMAYGVYVNKTYLANTLSLGLGIYKNNPKKYNNMIDKWIKGYDEAIAKCERDIANAPEKADKGYKAKKHFKALTKYAAFGSDIANITRANDKCYDKHDYKMLLAQLKDCRKWLQSQKKMVKESVEYLFDFDIK